jgi:hypothetical protein
MKLIDNVSKNLNNIITIVFFAQVPDCAESLRQVEKRRHALHPEQLPALGDFT